MSKRTTDPGTTQLVLPGWFPPEMPPSSEFVLPVADIVEHDPLALVGPEPDRSLVDSIGRYGIIHPVVLIKTETGYVVLDGRRRLKVAVKLGIAEVRALVYPRLAVLAGPAIGLSVNENRTRNVYAEYIAINQMFDAGATEHQVMLLTGLPIPTIRLRMTLGRLVPFLRDAFKAGLITSNVAQAAAKLSAAMQETLHDRYDELGKVTLTDIKHARLAVHQAAVKDLESMMVDDGPEDEPDGTDDDGVAPATNATAARYDRVFRALCRSIGPKRASEIAEGTDPGA